MYYPASGRILNRYFEEIARIPLLSPEEEAGLAVRIRGGDDNAARLLVSANLRFVVSVARKYQGSGLEFPDLIGEGNYGLVQAALRFDERLGNKFISYAVWWIRQAILQALSEKTRVVRLPLNKVGVQLKIRRAQDALFGRLEREPSMREVASELDIKEAKIEGIINYADEIVSLDERLVAGRSETLADQIPSPGLNLLAEISGDDSTKAGAQRALSFLQSREAEIVRLYFGIDCKQPLTLEEIGTRYGLTRERVRQIKENALRKLGDDRRKEVLQPHLEGFSPPWLTAEISMRVVDVLVERQKTPSEEEVSYAFRHVGRRRRPKAAEYDVWEPRLLEEPDAVDALLMKLEDRRKENLLRQGFQSLLASLEMNEGRDADDEFS